MHTQGKTCSKCGEYKPYTEFHKDKYQPSWYTCACKICNNTQHQERRKRTNCAEDKKWREANREKVLEYNKKQNKLRLENETPEGREKRLSYQRPWYREWYKKNKNKILEKRRKRKEELKNNP